MFAHPSGRILVVDDDPAVQKVIARLVESFGHRTETAADGAEALAKLHLDIDLVLLDLLLPGMDGYEVAGRIRAGEDWKDIPIIAVTGLDDEEHQVQALQSQIDAYITKPIRRTQLRLLLTSLLRMKRAHDAVKEAKADLEECVERRTQALRRALADSAQERRKTHEAHLDTIRRLSVAAEYKDEHTAQHISRMSAYCEVIAGALHLPPGEVERIHLASPMHDVGKIGIPDQILMKPGPLDPHEWEVMKQHTLIGARILHGSPSPLLQAGEVIALTHHEKWDGTGYPGGLRGEEIHRWGRICAVADVFDALTSRRPYKEPFSNDRALEIMREGRGSHFDPQVLDAFLDNLETILEIQARYRDDLDAAACAGRP